MCSLFSEFTHEGAIDVCLAVEVERQVDERRAVVDLGRLSQRQAQAVLVVHHFGLAFHVTFETLFYFSFSFHRVVRIERFFYFRCARRLEFRRGL